MASSSTSASSMMKSSSSSEEDLQQVMDQRKRRRMQSNRESAPRSRMRKQKHLDDLIAQVSGLTRENNQIRTSVNIITSQLYLNLEAENSVLRAQMVELNTRLQSLNEITDFINTSNGVLFRDDHQLSDESFMDPWDGASSCCGNQPIMASAEMIMY
ncbi:hypothetical protein SLE2022_178360 [Rubroshorea leprosula]